MSDVQAQLASMWGAKAFEPYLHHIRFPLFRNLEEGLSIEFSHPITAIVGPNGTNKSSILRALQGCPDYENIGRYWFGTVLDVIGSGERHRFVHGRWSDSAGAVVEVMKTRIQRRGKKTSTDPDYFEPSRPILGDGMARMPMIVGQTIPPDRTATRWKAIDKQVVEIAACAGNNVRSKCDGVIFVGNDVDRASRWSIGYAGNVHIDRIEEALNARAAGCRVCDDRFCRELDIASNSRRIIQWRLHGERGNISGA